LAKRIAVGLADASINFVDFKDANNNYCQGCDWCKKQDTPHCVQKDDMGALVEQMDSCDALILLAPIYYGELCAQAKTFVDRSYPFYNPAKPNMSIATKGDKKFALITTCGGPGSAYQDYDENLAKTFAVCGFTQQKALSLGNGSTPGGIAQDADAIAQLNELITWLKN
jgi:multimeric flavodoxin WrbA